VDEGIGDNEFGGTLLFIKSKVPPNPLLQKYKGVGTQLKGYGWQFGHPENENL
jgi:hypothetical protein